MLKKKGGGRWQLGKGGRERQTSKRPLQSDALGQISFEQVYVWKLRPWKMSSLEQSIPSYIPGRIARIMFTERHVQEPVFIIHNWEQPKCPSTLEWENRDYYTTVRMTKIQAHATVRMNLAHRILQCSYYVSGPGRMFHLCIA